MIALSRLYVLSPPGMFCQTRSMVRAACPFTGSPPHPTTQYYALLSPNSPSCTNGYLYGWVSASSYHTGGVNATNVDGSGRFVNESINTQNLTRRNALAAVVIPIIQATRALGERANIPRQF